MRNAAAWLGLPFLALLLIAGTALATRQALTGWAGTTAVADPPAVVFHEPFHGRPFEPTRPLNTGRWEVLAPPSVTARVEADGLLLEVPRATPGWLHPRLPLARGAHAGRVGGGGGWQETLQWESRVETLTFFFVVAELRFAPPQGALLLQATPVDVQVTTVTGAEERSDAVSYVAANDGRFHTWRLESSGERLTLSVAGSPRWSRPLPGRLAAVRFGEVRTDELHGGRLWLRDVTYVRRPA